MPNGKNAKRVKKVSKPNVEASGGNVFADLGFANPDLALAKAKLVQRIRGIIAARQLTQTGAAQLLGLDQPKVSALVRGSVEGYSLDRLIRFLNALGQSVEINVSASRNSKSATARPITVNY